MNYYISILSPVSLRPVIPSYHPCCSINIRTVSDERVQDFFPANPNTATRFHQVITFPWVVANGFMYCNKLAHDRPERAVYNVNSVALCTLGKPDPLHEDNCSFVSILSLYLHRNDWDSRTQPGYAVPTSWIYK